MRKLIQLIFFGIAIFSTFNLYAQNIAVNINSNATQLVTNHLLGGGIYATNISGTLSAAASGSFTATGNASFTLTGGIILSTGAVAGMPLTSTHFASTNLSAPGHPLLDPIVAPATTYDAQSITFDFKSASDSVEFDFVFASEEYNEYVNTPLNDVFAFFVTGPGFAPNTNVAVIPGTTTPITINTINNGGPYVGTSSGPCTNCSYYIDNVVQPSPIAFAYDGFTTTIKIKFPVWPCSDYTFTMVIADASDGHYDSAVLLGENTFIACPYMQISNRTTGIPTDTVYICAGGSLTLTAPQGSNLYWNTGDTTTSITVTQPGTYSVMYLDGICFAQTIPLVVLQSGSIQTPVITQNGTLLESNITPSPSITFQWSYNGVEIPGANGPVYTPTANGCYTLTIYEGTCESASNTVCVTNTSVAEWTSSLVQLVPNPSRDVVKIITPFQQGTGTMVTVTDMSGRILLEKLFSGSECLLDISSLSSGLYMMQLKNSAAAELVRKVFVVEK